MAVLEELDDETLVELAKKGDELGTETLIRRYKAMVVKTSRSYFLIGAEPEDLVQEGMIGLYKAILTYCADKAKFSTHAFVCIKSSILDAVKRANRGKNRALNDYEPLQEKNEQGGVHNILNTVEIEDLIEHAKEILSCREKEVFELYVDGYTTREMAEKLSITAKAVENSLHRIKKKINEIFID